VEVVELSGGPGSSRGPVAAQTRDGVEVWVDVALAYSVDPLRFRALNIQVREVRRDGFDLPAKASR